MMRNGAFGQTQRGIVVMEGLLRPHRIASGRPTMIVASLALCWLLSVGSLPLAWGESAPQPDRYSSLSWSEPVTLAQASHTPLSPRLEANSDGTLSLY